MLEHLEPSILYGDDDAEKEPSETPRERVTRKVLQDWGWAHQFNLRGVMSILDEIRGRRGVTPEMAKAAAEHQRYYEMVSSMLPTGEDGGEFGRETLSKLDSAHGHLMNLYEERGFRLGLAVATASRHTDRIVEGPRTWLSYVEAAERMGVDRCTVDKLVRDGHLVGANLRGTARRAVDSASLERYMQSCEVDAVPAEGDGGEGLEASPWEETAPDDDDPGPEPSDEERRANRLGYAAEGLRQARQQAILLPDHELEAYVAASQRRLDELGAGCGGAGPVEAVEASSTPPAAPADQREDAGRRRARVVQISEALREALSDLSRDIAEVSVDLDETMTLVLTRGVGRAALRARELTVAASQ